MKNATTKTNLKHFTAKHIQNETCYDFYYHSLTLAKKNNPGFKDWQEETPTKSRLQSEYAIFGYYNLEDRPNAEVIHFNSNINKVKEIYSHLTDSDKLDTEYLENNSINTENIEHLTITRIIKLNQIKR